MWWLRCVQGRELPDHRLGDMEGVWVVGISKGSAADAVGIEQGDQVLAVGDMLLTSISPFQAATLISGPDESGQGSAVVLQVQCESISIFRCRMACKFGSVLPDRHCGYFGMTCLASSLRLLRMQEQSAYTLPANSLSCC